MGIAGKVDEKLVDGGVVLHMFGSRRRDHVAPVSDEEILEFRAIKQRVLKMLDEWERIAGSGGCPVAARIIK